MTAGFTAEAHLRRIQAVTDPALSSLDASALITELLKRVREALQADTAAMLLLDPSGTELVVTASVGLEEEIRQDVRVRLGEGFTGRIAATAKPLVIDHVGPDTVASRVLIAAGLTTLAGVPVTSEGRVIGVLHVGVRQARVFTDDDIELLRLAADRASTATQVRLRQLDRSATLALQRSLLPARPGTIAGFDVAARYIPGQEIGVGGDWYDTFTLPSGHTGLVIGDIAGSGLQAAVIMGRIRSALRAYALESTDPAEVLRRLDRKVQVFEIGAMATVLYAVIPPERDHVLLSLAGHLPPLLVTRASAEVAHVHADVPLGAVQDAERRTLTVGMSPGAGLLLYTDGLVERRGRLLSAGIDELAAAVACPSADGMCTSALTVLHGNPATDDIAILAVLRAVL